ncbi:MAG: hypothetical protein ACHQHM_02410 [Thermoanaerobaculales bacterium]
MRRDVVLPAGIWFAFALALYVLTGAHGLVWADSSKLTLYAVNRYLPSFNPGDHAGWTLLAWAWLKVSHGDPVVWTHRLSALSGAFVVALSYLWALRRWGDRVRAHTLAVMLMVAQPLWWAATVAETYAPGIALVFAGSLALQEKNSRLRWFLAGGLWGLAIAVHALAVFIIVPLALEQTGAKSWKLLPAAALGFAPVWLAAFGGPLDPLTGFAASGAFTWGWHWEAFVAFTRAPLQAALLLGLFLYGVGPLGVVALLWRTTRTHVHLAWPVSLGALTLLLLGYAPYRLHLMVGFVLVGVLLATPAMLSLRLRLAHVVVQIALYFAVPALLANLGGESLGARVLPFRSNAFYFLCPIKSKDLTAPQPSARNLEEASSRSWVSQLRSALDPGAERYVAALDQCAPAGATVLADFNPGAVLRLAQVVRGWRLDLDVRPVAVDVALADPNPAAALTRVVMEALAAHPVVLADVWPPYYRVNELARRFDLECGVPCIRITRTRAAPPSPAATRQ